MPNAKIQAVSKYIIPSAILIGFVLFFAYDIYTLKKCLTNVDIYTYHFAYRQWFSQQLLNGNFPIWNPFWGIGQPVHQFISIPLDIFTILEIIFGPQYHYFQTFQLLLLLLIGCYAFVKLGFKPIIAACGILLFFMTPWSTYWSFYFVVQNTHITHILLFLFIFQWIKIKDKRYLFYIFWTTFFALLGTRAEFWFYEIVFCVFFSYLTAVLFKSGRLAHSLKEATFAILAMFIAVLTHTWQVNLLSRIISSSGRIVDYSMSNLFSGEMYHNLFLSIIESPLFKTLPVGFIFYLAFTVKKRLFRCLLLVLGLGLFWKLNIWSLPVIASFMNSPALVGSIIGLLLYLVFGKEKNWQDCLKAIPLFLLFVYYWCRPETGDLSELEIIRSAPFAFKALLSACVWLGCTRFSKNKLVKSAYFSILFIFIMRAQGQIILAYLAGLYWIPTRDNYFIDFAFAIIGMSGLAALDLPTLLINKYNWCKKLELSWIVSIVSIAIIIFSAYPNFYYCHALMKNAPVDYPYFRGIPKIRKLIKEVKDPALTRDFFVNYDAWGFTYGFGGCLLEGVGQVTMFDSLIPKRYKDWIIYRDLGIPPQANWNGYPGGYSEKTISLMPKRNTLGFNNWDIYRYTVIAQPPVDKNVFKLLGVKYLFNMSPISGEQAFAVDKGDLNRRVTRLGLTEITEIKGVAWPGVKESLFRGRLNEPLPRAYLLYNVTEEKLAELKNEMEPIVSEQNDFIKTKSYQFPLTPAKIEEYQPENVSITVNAKERACLVLSDMFHPFWHARLDGKETEIIPAFYIFRAVKVPAGKHRVDFYCEVPYFKTTVFFSLAMIVLGITVTFVYFKLR